MCSSPRRCRGCATRKRPSTTAMPAPRIAMWSHGDSVTLFGGVMGGTGWAEIEPIFQRLGASFSDCRSFDNEVIAAGASDDLAYTVAYEHTTASIHGAATGGVRAARHDGVPPRGRRVEGGPPSRRPVGITSRRRRPPATRAGPEVADGRPHRLRATDARDSTTRAATRHRHAESSRRRRARTLPSTC